MAHAKTQVWIPLGTLIEMLNILNKKEYGQFEHSIHSYGAIVCYLHQQVFFILSKEGSLVNTTDLLALYLSGTYCHKTGTRSPSCVTPRLPTIYPIEGGQKDVSSLERTTWKKSALFISHSQRSNTVVVFVKSIKNWKTQNRKWFFISPAPLKI